MAWPARTPRKAELQAYPKTILFGSYITLGVLRNRHEYLAYGEIDWKIDGPYFAFFAPKKELEIQFSCHRDGAPQVYTSRVPISQIKSAYRWKDTPQATSILLELSTPAIVFRKVAVRGVRNGYKGKDDPHATRLAKDHNISLSGQYVYSDIDFGQWLAFRLIVQQNEHHIEQFCDSLQKQNITVQQSMFSVQRSSPINLWDWLQRSSADPPDNDFGETVGALHLDASTITLPFDVLYQLEVCISNGWLRLGSLSHDFATKLASLVPPAPQKPTRACKPLEALAAAKKTLDDPMKLFSMSFNSPSNQQRLPSYCTRIRTATITPMTIYFNTPAVDTSNRILRKYRHYEDRFLRVKFRDELHAGRLRCLDEGMSSQAFDRVKAIMKEGIVVGKRKFEFLAFGNSQFREHGAYFFAPTHDLTAEDIRREMGIFDSIKVVAKYAARLGQCFSTTRTTSNSVQMLHIPDIYHNGFCFTDGVGKISHFMAQMIAQDMRLPSSAQHCPTVFQFRLAGCKGVLAVDPQVKGTAICIRPSQNKFDTKHTGLEVIRAGQFSASFLNQQVILILSALGVKDEIFTARLKTMLTDIDKSVTDEEQALRLLQRTIDVNQTTIQLAEMIKAGFMTTKEPFLETCMQLWRAWTIKYLKEKAKILIEQGAFLLGCVDECNVLKGHYNISEEQRGAKAQEDLPEIFLQISVYDPDTPGKRIGFKVIDGLCLVIRNPALHPGDVRVVMAVDRPELHHLRDVVVFPQSGDRDLPSMCAGGDLDGDDFLIIWDQELIPERWNVPAMDYTAPSAAPSKAEGPVTIDAIIDFYVEHMKNDNLGLIATAHRYWADRLPHGVDDQKCIQLASLHSQAVDYAKTGVPAPFPAYLKTSAWPHWAESKVNSSKVYHSKKVLGQLYDLVDRLNFVPNNEVTFNERILAAHELDEEILIKAATLKAEYDIAVQELMLQQDIKTEFEVWTGFVMQHSNTQSDYKLPEMLGQSMTAIKQNFKSLAYEQAGTNDQDRDASKIEPFIAAMYMVTAEQTRNASALAQEMPCMSFPWIFARELGVMAQGRPFQETSLPAFPSIALPPTDVPTPPATPLLGNEIPIFDPVLPLPELSALMAVAIQPDQEWFSETAPSASDMIADEDGDATADCSERVEPIKVADDQKLEDLSEGLQVSKEDDKPSMNNISPTTEL